MEEFCKGCDFVMVEVGDKPCCLASAGEQLAQMDKSECPIVLEHFDLNRYSDACLTCDCLDIEENDSYSCELGNCVHNIFEAEIFIKVEKKLKN